MTGGGVSGGTTAFSDNTKSVTVASSVILVNQPPTFSIQTDTGDPATTSRFGNVAGDPNLGQRGYTTTENDNGTANSAVITCAELRHRHFARPALAARGWSDGHVPCHGERPALFTAPASPIASYSGAPAEPFRFRSSWPGRLRSGRQITIYATDNGGLANGGNDGTSPIVNQITVPLTVLPVNHQPNFTAAEPTVGVRDVATQTSPIG